MPIMGDRVNKFTALNEHPVNNNHKPNQIIVVDGCPMSKFIFIEAARIHVKLD